MSQAEKVKGVADIVFLMDATGSMGPCINQVKQNIKAFVQTLTTADPNGGTALKEWRAKVVGYRDLDYTDFPAYVDHPFVSSIGELESQLAGLQAAGGGDEPETLLEALYRLATMPVTAPGAALRPDAWRPSSKARRFVIVFTDAPFKEPLREPRGASIDDVINNLMSGKVILHLFAPAVLPRFDTLAETDKAEWHRITGDGSAQEVLASWTSDVSNFRKIIEQLAKTITVESDVPPAPEE